MLSLTPRLCEYAALFALSLLLPISKAHALGADMGDFIAPSPGHDLLAAYAFVTRASHIHEQGRVVNREAESDITSTIFRYAHPIQIGSTIINPQFFITRQDTNVSHSPPLKDTQGIEDPAIGAPFWLIADRSQREYLMIAPWLFLPLGAYDHKDYLNPGENRWKGLLQIGYQRGITEHLDVEGMIEANFYGKNDSYGPDKSTRRQRPWYEAKGGVNYLFNDPYGTKVGVGGYLDRGGENKIDGQLSNDAVDTHGFYIEAARNLSSSDQLLLGFFRDLKVENGFRIDQQFRLRYLHVF